MLSPDQPDSTAHWVKSAVVAALLHAVAIGGLLLNVRFVNAGAPPAAMVVELASLPTAPPTPPSDRPLGPVQHESKPEKPKPVKKKLPFVPPPRLTMVKPPEVVVQHQEEPRPDVPAEAKKPVEETTAPPTTEARQDGKLAAPVIGSNSSGPMSPEMTWENQVLAQLERYKRYPREARFHREEDVVYVRFVVNREGEVLSASIVRSQGFPLLDGEVLALLKRAAPLPEPPPGVKGDRIEMVVPVEFYIHRG
jgi:protein TonB